MRDDAYTDPVAIRALYSSRGRNSKLNVAKAESLGVTASQMSPTEPNRVVAGDVGGIGVASAQTGYVGDPTYYNQPDLDYSQSRYFLFDGTDQFSLNNF